VFLDSLVLLVSSFLGGDLETPWLWLKRLSEVERIATLPLQLLFSLDFRALKEGPALALEAEEVGWRREPLLDREEL
jgi:hypothetical protein